MEEANSGTIAERRQSTGARFLTAAMHHTWINGLLAIIITVGCLAYVWVHGTLPAELANGWFLILGFYFTRGNQTPTIQIAPTAPRA